MRIGVFGLGYVGTVNATCLAERGHTVIGVDVDGDKTALINTGLSPVTERGLAGRLASVVSEGTLRTSSDAVSAVQHTDISIVCVGTPSNGDGSLHLEFVKHVSEEIAHGLRDKRDHHVVVFRSTMLPGTVEDELIPILTATSGRQPGCGYSVVYHPEFLREGSAMFDFENPAKVVVGHRAGDVRGKDALCELYADLDVPITFTTIRVAEAVKYIDNVFHALKVSFANEIGNICKELSVDSHEAMRIFCEDTKLNLSPAYLRPGYAFGGSCLPKDLRALMHEARSRDVATPLLEAIQVSNEHQKARALHLVSRTGKRRIGILGLSFKVGTDDLRESPAVELVEHLLGAGRDVAIYDPHIRLDRLVGANRSLVERKLPHIASLLRSELDDVLRHSDVLVVTNECQEFSDVATRLHPEQILIDLVRLPTLNGHGHNYVGISW